MDYEVLSDDMDYFIQKYNSTETEHQNFTPDETISEAIEESKEAY